MAGVRAGQRGDPLLRSVADRPEALALEAGTVSWSHHQLLDATDDLACALHAEGVRAGHRVASLTGDGWPAVVLLHALRRLGAVAVPLDRRAAPLSSGP